MMLFSCHIDVIILEARIVDYFRNRFKQRRDRLKHGDIGQAFEPSVYFAATQDS
ncbi:hypothetical protein [Shewanella insulae]|uniref:hypothetical protein n=1 Tax=Shewanella insulae TaxID=2681496 RepID=UPI00247FCEBA|nr:hypothetical protein [Shewanella insulae]